MGWLISVLFFPSSHSVSLFIWIHLCFHLWIWPLGGQLHTPQGTVGVQNTIWTGDAFIQKMLVLVFQNSVGLVQDAGSLHFLVCLSLRRDNESSVRLHHSLTSQSLCLGASLSPHLVPLILVCLEGDRRQKWVAARRSGYWPINGWRNETNSVNLRREPLNSGKASVDIFSGGSGSIGLQITQIRPWQWLLRTISAPKRGIMGTVCEKYSN